MSTHFTTTLLSRWSLPTTATATATIIIIIVCLYHFLLKNKTNKTPPLPPCPKGLPFLGNLLSLQPDLHKHFTNLSLTYGPIYRLKLGNKIAIVITSPSIAKEVLRDHDTTFANRDVSAAAREFSYDGNNIVFGSYTPQWRMMRKICVSQMLSNSSLKVYGLQRREVRWIVNHLYLKAGSPVNVCEHMFATLMNVITSMLWGGEEGGMPIMGTEFKQVIEEMTKVLGRPNISDYLPMLARFDLQGISRKMRGLLHKCDKIFDTIIAQRIKLGHEKGNTSKDLLGLLLKLMNKENEAKIPFTKTHVKAILMDMVLGGTDSTSNSLEFALAEMMNKPHILKKAQAELDRVVGKDNVVEEVHINKLPYLFAIMKETLRIHPPVPLLIPHCPSADCNVAGYAIPKGSQIFINVWAMHRDPSIWEDPMEFRPERFLDAKLDFSGQDFSFFPFGSGRRMCLGVYMAERMFMHLLASMIHSFDWSLPHGKQLEMSDKYGIVSKKKVPLVAIPSPRLDHPSLYNK